MPPSPVVIIGAGPAGLTAAYELAKRQQQATVFESEDTVGGISRTVERDGWRFDLGGHRFFTRVAEVEALWDELLTEEEFVVRPRLSRILYKGKLFDYPLRPLNALRGPGLRVALLCTLSYLWAQVFSPRNPDSFEGWVSQRFGRRLYEIFFKTYTEKIWGMPAAEINADWAAQRIKNLSLSRAILGAFSRSASSGVTSLIEEFRYPVLGPGMMWERAAQRASELGASVRLRTQVTGLLRGDTGVSAVEVTDQDGRHSVHSASHVISTMPLTWLVNAMRPAAPPEVLSAAGRLSYRDFLTVALVVPEASGFPDNWVYIHTPGVRLGRIQNFRAWSEHMVKPGWTCLGLEYFVNRGDDLWSMPDGDLVSFATSELASLGLVDVSEVSAGYAVRVPMAYPVYDSTYRAAVEEIREWLALAVPNVHPVGRNGMHKYNNQDHSMYTAMLAVQNICLGTAHDLWSVNVEAQYHEERAAPVAITQSRRSAGRLEVSGGNTVRPNPAA